MKMIGDSTCTGCLYPAVIGRIYSNNGVGLLLYLSHGYAKTLERDKADTIPTPFLCLIIDVSQGVEKHDNSMKIKSLLLALFLLTVGVSANAQINVRGYKGMVNAGWIFADNSHDYSKSNVSVEILTVHGYQFNPYLFAGIGAGIELYRGDKTTARSTEHAEYIPLFADVRGHLLKGRISPYADAKIGYQFACDNGGGGLYCAPEIGCCFGLARHCAITVSAEYIVQNTESASFGNGYDPNTGGFAIKLGVEF